MKYNIIKIGFALLPLLGAACTGNYLEINTNPYEVSSDQMQTNGYIIAASLSGMAGTVISTDVNTTQFTDCLLGGPMGGYFASSNASWSNTFDNYNPTNDWSRVFMNSDEIIPKLYTNLNSLQEQTDDEMVLAIANIIKVAAMHRVTDTYGPIPYSKIEVGGDIAVAYDSQEEVYTAFFEELNAAIEVLGENRTGGISATADNIYAGSAEKWCKFANSLKLRLAMRIVYADAAKAKEMVEEVTNNEIGPITSNDDNAYVPSSSFGSAGNPIYVAVNYNANDSDTGGDTHAAADITTYMKLFGDPRAAQYFRNSSDSSYEYVGLRRGIIIPELSTIGKYYSGVKIDIDTPLCWLNAAEVAFLKAEAALFGFSVGDTAANLYEEGVRLSFEQWGVSGVDDYLANDQLVQVVYTDPIGTNTYSSPVTTTSIAWDDSATTDVKQERIITQKWIANWKLGNEAWADYRRTGYPRLFPATDAGNKSGGVVDSTLGARRMAYPQEEITTNYTNYQYAVSTLLGGTDNMATRMWWDQNPSIN